jgi:hypothetical protein
MSGNSDAIFVLVLGSVSLAALALWVIVHQLRLRKKIAAAGPDAIRVRLRANRLGAAAGLVPVIEELLTRVERLEAEVAALKRHDR